MGERKPAQKAGRGCVSPRSRRPAAGPCLWGAAPAAERPLAGGTAAGLGAAGQGALPAGGLAAGARAFRSHPAPAGFGKGSGLGWDRLTAGA